MPESDDDGTVCRYCASLIEKRDGEWVTEYGNDPQCDDSPIGMGDHRPGGEACPHGLSAWLCEDPINHYRPDRPGR